jgi:hypothetical protein
LRGSGAQPLDQDWSSKTNCPKTGGVVERDDHEASENGAGDPLLRGEVEARTFWEGQPRLQDQRLTESLDLRKKRKERTDDEAEPKK